MGKRQTGEKLKASRRVESDRDDSIHHKGATSLEQNGEFRKENRKTEKACEFACL